jgi:hypothetical protein
MPLFRDADRGVSPGDLYARHFIETLASGVLFRSSRLPGAPALQAAVQAPKPAPENGGGYSLSEHVKRYYKTARL